LPPGERLNSGIRAPFADGIAFGSETDIPYPRQSTAAAFAPGGCGVWIRKEALEEITALAVDIEEQLDEHAGNVVETAFRYAAETWMQSHNMIRVTRNGEVLPPFYHFGSH
jgi:hypothetical protein